MIDRRLLRAKLDSLRLYLRRLRPLARLSFTEFAADYTRFNTAERNVQLVVDAAVDVNNHLILEAGESAARDYYESFEKLGRLGILARNLASRLARTTGLRNRIVHQYEDVDLDVLYRNLVPFLRDYERYCAEISRRAK